MQKARRKQYPLNYNICSTAHKAMGETLPSIATRIEDGSHYQLWDRNQLLVIISRVQSLDRIYFVGDWLKTIRALRKILLIECPLTKLQSEILTRMDILNDPTIRIIPPTRSRFMRFLECDVPAVDVGFVYLFSSAKSKDVIKFGHCENIQKKIKELHSHSNAVSDPYAPYILIGYFCGFFGDVGDERNQSDRMRLCDAIQRDIYVNTIGLFRMLDHIKEKCHALCGNPDTQPWFKHVYWKDCYEINRNIVV